MHPYDQSRAADRLAEYERRKLLTPFERRAIREQRHERFLRRVAKALNYLFGG